MSCHPRYLSCKENGMKTCVCEKDKIGLLRLIKNKIERTYNKLGDKKLAELLKNNKNKNLFCMFRKPVIKEIDSVIRCFLEERDESFLKNHCPSHVICDDKYIFSIYKYRDYHFKNPDVLIVKGKMFTMIVEEKGYGKQNRSRFEEQINSSYMNLPMELKTNCVFLVYAPQKGGTLPLGFVKDKQLNLLAMDLGRSIAIYDIPVFVIEQRERQSSLF